MELTAIIAALLLAVGAAVVLTGLAVQVWVTVHPGQPEAAARRAARVAGRLSRLLGRGHPIRGLGPGGDILMLTLAAGLAVVTLAALAVGKLVDDATHGEGVAAVDHPAARFVATHRAAELTAVMRAVSVIGGPAGMTVLALAAGLLLGVAWRWWAPPAVLTITATGIIGLTIVFKAALGRARPPLAQAVAAAGGYGFPSAHAAAAAAVCGAAAWLCSVRMRSWRARIAVWAAAAMLAGLVGISRVYLGVHWVSDVIGGWIFGIMWMAVVVTGWATLQPRYQRGKMTDARGPTSPGRWPLR
jgi:undecaprenyl-diphosphatase